MNNLNKSVYKGVLTSLLFLGSLIIPAIGSATKHQLPVCKNSPATKERIVRKWTDCKGAYSNDFMSFEGAWKDGRFHGYGTYKNKNGVQFSGEYRRSQMFYGTLEITSLDSSRQKKTTYTGYFNNMSMPHGKGKKIFADGTIQQGIWDDGVFQHSLNSSARNKLFQKKLGQAFMRLSSPQRLLVQINLKEKGFYTGSLDGLYGPKTQAAIKLFEKSEISQIAAQTRNAADELLNYIMAGNVAKMERDQHQDKASEVLTSNSFFEANRGMNAVTEDGRKVFLNTDSMTWSFILDDKNLTSDLVFENEYLRISLTDQAHFKRKKKGILQTYLPTYEVHFLLEALHPTKIVKYKTHVLARSDDGATVSDDGATVSDDGATVTSLLDVAGKDYLSNYVTDNFGNRYRVCSGSIDGDESFNFEYSEGIFFGEPKRLTIGICGKLLKSAEYLKLIIRSSVFDGVSYDEEIRFKIPLAPW